MLLSRVLVIGNILLDVHGRERSRAEVGAGMWVCVLWSCVSSGTSVCVCVRVCVNRAFWGRRCLCSGGRLCVCSGAASCICFWDGERSSALFPEPRRACVPANGRAWLVCARLACELKRVCTRPWTPTAARGPRPRSSSSPHTREPQGNELSTALVTIPAPVGTLSDHTSGHGLAVLVHNLLNLANVVHWNRALLSLVAVHVWGTRITY